MRRVILWLIYRVILKNTLKLFTGLRYNNRTNILTDEPCIIVANHNSHLDTISILSALPTKQLLKTHPVAAGDYFGKSRLKSYFSEYFINALLIPRKRPEPNSSDPDPIQMMLDVLDKGESLILFPEGSRGEPEVFQKFKKGVGILLSERPNVQFIPIYFKGLGKVMPKGDPLPVPFLSSADIGVAELPETNEPDQITDQVQKAILRLREAN